MAYERRGKELNEQLKNLLDIADKERLLLQGGIDQYVGARQRALEEVVALTQRTSEDTLESRWADTLKPLRERLSWSIGDALANVDSRTATDKARDFKNTTLSHDDAFLSGLLAIKVVACRDAIVRNQKELRERTESLKRRWEAIMGSNEALLEKERQVAYDLKRMVKETLKTSAELNRTLKEKMASGALTLAKLGKTAMQVTGVSYIPQVLSDAKQLFGAAESAAQNGAENWLKTNDAYRGRVREYKALVENQGAVFFTFKQTRQDTEDFVRENGFDKVKSLYQSCADELNRWSSAQKSDALRDDAAELAKALLEALSAQLAATEKAFNAFVFENKEKFYGPLGPDIKAALADTRSWERITSELQDGGVEGQLRQWRDQAGGSFTLDLESAFVRSLEGMENLTRDEERQAKKELEAFRDTVTQQIRERVTALVKQLTDALTLLEERQQRQDFDRKPLSDKLS